MKTTSLALAFLTCASSALAASFGVNFSNSASDGGGWTSAGGPALTSGDLGVAAWTTTDMSTTWYASETGRPLVSGVALDYSGSGDVDSRYGMAFKGLKTSAQQGLFFNFLTNDIDNSDADNVGARFTVSGLSGWLTANGATAYTLTVYLAANQSSYTFGAVNVNAGASPGSSLGTTSITLSGDGAFDGVSNVGTSAGTRAISSLGNLSANTITVSMSELGDIYAGTANGIAGFSIATATAVPEPSAYGLIGAAALAAAALVRRRRAKK